MGRRIYRSTCRCFVDNGVCALRGASGVAAGAAGGGASVSGALVMRAALLDSSAVAADGNASARLLVLAMYSGSAIVNVVPTAGVLCASIVPPCAWTIAWLALRPRSLPTPTGLVVKNGSKMCGRSVGCHTRPGIDDIDHDAGRSADGLPTRAHRQHASRGAVHGVFCVDHEVEQHLLQPLIVADGRRWYRNKLCADLNACRL